MRIKKYQGFWVLLFVAFTLSACSTIELISQYDDETDKNVTALHKDVTTFLTKLGNQTDFATCSHASNIEFYEQARINLTTITVRAQSIPKNDITIEMLGNLGDSIDTLEQLHMIKNTGSKCLTKDELAPIQSAFNVSTTSILRLETAKKRGESSEP